MGSIENIVRAVRAQPNSDTIAVVGVGPVAESGDRNPSHHWGRVGDPLRAARHDEYAQSTIIAEKTPVDSGLSKWVWLRQTGIIHDGIVMMRDPINLTAKDLGVKDIKKWYERNWFATRNFHGFWYTESDRLEELVPFRQDTIEQALAHAAAVNPEIRAASKMPPWVMKHLILRPIVLKTRGLMGYVKDNDTAKINAYFGSREAWEQIGISWG